MPNKKIYVANDINIIPTGPQGFEHFEEGGQKK